MQTRKAIHIVALTFAFAVSFSIVAFFLYKYVNQPQKDNTVNEPLSLLDSMAFKYDLNIDSLRNDSSFIRLLTKDLTEDDIYTQMLSYSDDEVIAKFTDTTKAYTKTEPFIPTDSLRMIMARNDLIEEKLTDYVTDNQERFNLQKEKKGLVKEVSTLQKQIDTISTQTEKVISEYKNKNDSLNLVARENAEMKRQIAEFKEQDIAKLVKMCEAMKPLDAAKMIAQLPDDKAVKLLKRMNNRQAGKILAALPSSMAANLSLLIMNDKK